MMHEVPRPAVSLACLYLFVHTHTHTRYLDSVKLPLQIRPFPQQRLVLRVDLHHNR